VSSTALTHAVKRTKSVRMSHVTLFSQQ